jgi:hypothetical protein
MLGFMYRTGTTPAYDQMVGTVRGVIVSLSAVVALVALSGGAAATAPAKPPLADAGLDQETEVGHTVRLDATGSRDPDGAIAGYEWTIEAPNGTTAAPACQTCGQTSFRPTRHGQYNVTVTVTGERGMRRSDTLHVTVEPGAGPTATLTGTAVPEIGTLASYTGRIRANGVGLERAEWLLNGTVVREVTISGQRDVVGQDLTFENASARSLRLRAIDVAGQTTTERLLIEPRVGGASAGGAPVDKDYRVVHWGDMTYTINSPRLDEDGERYVPGDTPNMDEMNAMATADLGAEVRDDFTSDETGGETSEQRKPSNRMGGVSTGLGVL